jgi:L-ribulose-5-phosphate 3-epimerase UlaE
MHVSFTGNSVDTTCTVRIMDSYFDDAHVNKVVRFMKLLNFMKIMEKTYFLYYVDINNIFLSCST